MLTIYFLYRGLNKLSETLTKNYVGTFIYYVHTKFST